jgi:hypothetical protein
MWNRHPRIDESENSMIWVSHFVDFGGFCTEYTSKSFIYEPS